MCKRSENEGKKHLFQSHAFRAESIEGMPFDLEKYSLAFFSLKDYDLVIDQFNDSIELIKTAKSPRTIIIESWSIVDYAIRHIICYLLGLLEHGSGSFSVHYELLPRSFRESVDMLKKILSEQRRRDNDPAPPRIDIPGHFRSYLLKIDKGLFDKLLKMEYEFIKDNHPEYDPNTIWMKGHSRMFRDEPCKTVDLEDLERISFIDDNWFSAVEKINKARNISAHRVGFAQVYRVFGLHSTANVDRLRQSVLSTLDQIIVKSKIQENK